MNAPPAITPMQSLRRIGSDRRRLEQHLGQAGSLSHRPDDCLRTGFQALLWRRLARSAFVKGWKHAARLTTQGGAAAPAIGDEDAA